MIPCYCDAEGGSLLKRAAKRLSLTLMKAALASLGEEGLEVQSRAISLHHRRARPCRKTRDIAASSAIDNLGSAPGASEDGERGSLHGQVLRG